jgi:hypothetical protein
MRVIPMLKSFERLAGTSTFDHGGWKTENTFFYKVEGANSFANYMNRRLSFERVKEI